MDIYRERYGPQTVFIFASDDPGWTKHHFGSKRDVISTNDYRGAPGDRVAFDMGALSFCNHSIFRYKWQPLHKYMYKCI